LTFTGFDVPILSGICWPDEQYPHPESRKSLPQTIEQVNIISDPGKTSPIKRSSGILDKELPHMIFSIMYIENIENNRSV
jgi:hypothetical protein